MARDALESQIDPVTGEVIFPNLPRKPDGTPDWDRLGGERPFKVRDRDGRVHVVDPKPSVPHPNDGRPVRPE